MDPGFDLQRYPILVVDDEQDNLDAFRFNFRKVFDLRTVDVCGWGPAARRRPAAPSSSAYRSTPSACRICSAGLGHFASCGSRPTEKAAATRSPTR